MGENDLKKTQKTSDSVLQEQLSHSVETESFISTKRPRKFSKINKSITKIVALYFQLLWDGKPNGKMIKIQDIISNSSILFNTRFESKDMFVIRHIASDIREIDTFLGLRDALETYYKNIDLDREDISLRIDLSHTIYEYFSEIIHFNYKNSYTEIKNISSLMEELKEKSLIIPDSFDQFFEKSTFAEVANNHGSKSFKDSMKNLDNSSRKISDSHLHTQIRKKEVLPNSNQVDFSNDIDVLLAEIYRVLK